LLYFFKYIFKIKEKDIAKRSMYPMYAVLVLMLFRVALTNTEPISKFESLSHIYSTYSESPGVDHYTKYAPAYDENISHLRENAFWAGTKVQMLEIGVQSGGSTRTWKRYFRGLLSYVGLDNDPRCRMFQSLAEGIRIVIGSQSHPEVLSEICTKYGPFDLVIDDGGHTNKMSLTALKSLWNCMKDDGVYVIEDLHALNLWPHEHNREATLFKEMEKWMIWRSPMKDYNDYEKLRKYEGYHLKKLTFSDSILFLHYAENVTSLGRFMTGDHWLKGSRNSEDPPSKLFLRDWCKNCCIGCYDD